jgi:hypothetical protein
MGREAAGRKGRVAVSLPEPFRRFPVGGHEPAVGVPKLLADFPRRGVDENVGQPLDLGGLFVADQNGLVAARPDPVVPAGQVADLRARLPLKYPMKRESSRASRTQRRRTLHVAAWTNSPSHL